jgi:hypothetical protein
MYIAPLLPFEEVPVLRTITPLTPLEPALAVAINNDPLVETELKPLINTTRPPLDEEEVPADITNSPPDPLFPDPTDTYTDPPRPELDTPLPKYRPPELP